jgi:hypothetical protein
VTTLREDELEPLRELGLKLAVVPDGSPATLRAMLPENPFSAAVKALYVAVPPARIVCEPGATDKEKSTTLRPMLVGCVMPWPVAVIVGA